MTAPTRPTHKDLGRAVDDMFFLLGLPIFPLQGEIRERITPRGGGFRWLELELLAELEEEDGRA